MLERRRRRVGKLVVDAVEDEPVVADVQRAGDAVTDDALGLQWGQQDRRGDRGDNAHRSRCRQQPAGSRPVEAAQPDGACSAYLAVKHSGDEESRDDEEHVDAGEPTAHAGHAGMKEHDGQHRDGTQAFEVLAKCRLRRTQAPRLRDGADALNVCHRHQLGEGQLSRMVDTCEIATGAAMSVSAPITV